MTSFHPAIRHTTTPLYPVSDGIRCDAAPRDTVSLKSLIVKAFFNRNTSGLLPYSERVGRNFGRKGILLATLLAAGCGPAGAGDRSWKAREEYKARPACAGIVDEKTWTDCMARFKDVRPAHPPTTLQFEDWRT